MGGKKIHFFNVKWRDYSWWSRSLIFTAILIIYYLPKLFVSEEFSTYLGLATYSLFIGYIIYESTRKNAVHYRRENVFTIKLAGKKVEMDVTFISQVWIEDDQLHIRRINRVDTFPISHLRQADLDKLVVILKEYESQEI